MRPHDQDCHTLAYLLKEEVLSFEQVISWSLSQYSDQGIDPFIEKIGSAIDLDNLYEILSSRGENHQVSDAFIVGAGATQYIKTQDSSIMNDLVHDSNGDIDLPKDDLEILLDAWGYGICYSDYPLSEAEQNNYEEKKKNALPILEKYVSVYEQAIEKFIS